MHPCQGLLDGIAEAAERQIDEFLKFPEWVTDLDVSKANVEKSTKVQRQISQPKDTRYG